MHENLYEGEQNRTVVSVFSRLREVNPDKFGDSGLGSSWHGWDNPTNLVSTTMQDFRRSPKENQTGGDIPPTTMNTILQDKDSGELHPHHRRKQRLLQCPAELESDVVHPFAKK